MLPANQRKTRRECNCCRAPPCAGDEGTEGGSLNPYHPVSLPPSTTRTGAVHVCSWHGSVEGQFVFQSGWWVQLALISANLSGTGGICEKYVGSAVQRPSLHCCIASISTPRGAASPHPEPQDRRTSGPQDFRTSGSQDLRTAGGDPQVCGPSRVPT